MSTYNSSIVQSYFLQNPLYDKYKCRRFNVNSQEETEDFINLIISYRYENKKNILSMIVNKYVETFLCMRALTECIGYIYDIHVTYDGNLETIEGIQNDSLKIKLDNNKYIDILKTSSDTFTIKYSNIDEILYYYNVIPKKVFDILDKIIYDN